MLFSSSFRCARNFTLIKLSRRLLETLRSSPMLQQQQQMQHQQSFRKYGKEIKGGETFNTPRPPKDPPDDYKPTSFDHNAFDAPECLPCSIFRQFSSPDEKLGPSAGKDAHYKNPEYYAYHRFTFVEMQLNVLELRRQAICNDNAKCIYDYESDDETDKSKAADNSADKDGKKKVSADGEKGKSCGNKNENKAKDDKAAPSGGVKK